MIKNILIILSYLLISNYALKNPSFQSLKIYNELCINDQIDCKEATQIAFQILEKIDDFTSEKDFYELNFSLITLLRTNSWNLYSEKEFSDRLISYFKTISCNEIKIPISVSERFFRTLFYNNELILRSYNVNTFKNNFLYLAEFNNGFHIWSPTIKNYMYILQFYSKMYLSVNTEDEKSMISKAANQIMSIGSNIFTRNLKQINYVSYIPSQNSNFRENNQIFPQEYNKQIIIYTDIMSRLSNIYDFKLIDNMITQYTSILQISKNFKLYIYIFKNKESFNINIRLLYPDKYYYDENDFYDINYNDNIINIFTYKDILFNDLFKKLYHEVLITYFFSNNTLFPTNNNSILPHWLLSGMQDFCHIENIRYFNNLSYSDLKKNILNNKIFAPLILQYILVSEKQVLQKILLKQSYSINIKKLIQFSQNYVKACTLKNSRISNTYIQLSLKKKCNLVTFTTQKYIVFLSKNNMQIQYANNINKVTINRDQLIKFISILKSYIIINHFNSSFSESLLNNYIFYNILLDYDNKIVDIKCDNNTITDRTLLSIYFILDTRNTLPVKITDLSKEINKCYIKPVILNKPMKSYLNILMERINYNKKNKLQVAYLKKHLNTQITDLSCKIHTVKDYLKYTNIQLSKNEYISSRYKCITSSFVDNKFRVTPNIEDIYNNSNHNSNNNKCINKNMFSHKNDSVNDRILNQCFHYYDMYQNCMDNHQYMLLNNNNSNSFDTITENDENNDYETEETINSAEYEEEIEYEEKEIKSNEEEKEIKSNEEEKEIKSNEEEKEIKSNEEEKEIKNEEEKEIKNEEEKEIKNDEKKEYEKEDKGKKEAKEKRDNKNNFNKHKSEEDIYDDDDDDDDDEYNEEDLEKLYEEY